MKYSIITLILIAICSSACENRIVIKPDNEGAYKRQFDLLLTDLITSNLDSLTMSDSLFEFRLLEKNGSDRKIDSDDFVQKIYLSTCDTTMNFPLPYLRIKDGDNIILFTNGKGMWGEVNSYVLFETKEQRIVDVRCDHKSEAPVTKVSFKDTAYSNRYRNLKIESSQSTPIIIDGLTGATVTSKAYEKSIIEGVKLYDEIWL